ncbi:peptide-N-glycosidase F-related protein [Chryseobacterium jejuense]|uniref:Por secretion system C-terminal sorting domain n=1 Tax=Chryseobacterium jejuense TaxID=445960 RepID=A0A2X2VIR1_CHRJE|nr:peptide-N-glycosidase F-related protein [Chryseobacterium jejuense]SDJ20002.1 Por secretion system C-terminal sorting domain-containing protein [Chryseobacterium jejuense]SQB28458.1 Por secretion system C-terminal sorting domain [Chryseobacterium jejuense]
MYKRLFFASLFLTGLFKSQTTTVTNLISDAVYYDGYAPTTTQPVPSGLIRLGNTRYAKKLTDAELDSFKAKIAMRVTIGALCDNYDRLGEVFLALVPKNQPTYTMNDANVKRIEAARYITPFMNKNRAPIEVPFTYDISNLNSVFHNTELRNAYDMYMELDVFGVPYAAQTQVAGCANRIDVFSGNLTFFSTDAGATPTDYNTLVPILSYNKLNNYNSTDVSGETVRLVTFNLPTAVSNARFFVISTPHGAGTGGEEYVRRQNYTYIDDVQVLTYTPGGISCEPFRAYNTQGNGIYQSAPATFAQWTSWNNWCPGNSVPIRGFTLPSMTAGNHTLKHTVPTAVFNGKDGDVFLSVYMQGKSNASLHVKDVKTIDVNIYPNPTTDFVNVKSKEDVASMTLFSIDGRKLAEIYRENRINLSSYNTGVYFLNIVLKDGTTFKHKIIKK